MKYSLKSIDDIPELLEIKIIHDFFYSQYLIYFLIKHYYVRVKCCGLVS